MQKIKKKIEIFKNLNYLVKTYVFGGAVIEDFGDQLPLGGGLWDGGGVGQEEEGGGHQEAAH
jgi:hypothetical protein